MRQRLGTGDYKQLTHDQQQNADLDKTESRGNQEEKQLVSNTCNIHHTLKIQVYLGAVDNSKGKKLDIKLIKIIPAGEF